MVHHVAISFDVRTRTLRRAPYATDRRSPYLQSLAYVFGRAGRPRRINFPPHTDLMFFLVSQMTSNLYGGSQENRQKHNLNIPLHHSGPCSHAFICPGSLRLLSSQSRPSQASGRDRKSQGSGLQSAASPRVSHLCRCHDRGIIYYAVCSPVALQMFAL